jgi:DnaJ-class molecular chaperone
MSIENTNDDHQPAGLGAMTGSAFWVLFEHMSQNHNLTLLDSELNDICHTVDRMREKWKADEARRRCRTCWGSGQVEIQSGPYYRTCDACGGSGQNAGAVTRGNNLNCKILQDSRLQLDEEQDSD